MGNKNNYLNRKKNSTGYTGEFSSTEQRGTQLGRAGQNTCRLSKPFLLLSVQ